MKKLAIALALTSTLTACGSMNSVSTDPYVKQAEVQQQLQTRQDKIAMKAVESAPEWMTKLPKSPNAVYENGTAISSDFAMADVKARTIAYAKICMAAGGKVRSQSKIYRSDSDNSSSEASELAIRSICPDVDITGVETVETKHIPEGGRIRSYVLVALPTGSANALQSRKDRKAEREAAAARAPAAFDELDNITAKDNKQQ